jgi:hypothetical protein
MMNKGDWYWCGYAGHFICGNRCAFHLATVLPNGYIVSTVGHYLTDPDERPREIGVDCLFETMVFHCNGLDEHLNPKITDYSEVDFEGYNDSELAEKGHYLMCEKWSKESNG